MSLAKKLIGQTAVYGLSSILGRLLNYLLVPLYTRIFERAEYGVVSELYAYVTFLMVVFTYGMETAFFRYVNVEKDKVNVYSTALNSVIITSIILVSAICIFVHPIADGLSYTSHPEYIIYFALILGLDAISAIPFAKLRQENKALRFAGLKFINILINVILNLYFLLLCPYLYKHDPSSPFLFMYKPGIGIAYIFISNFISSLITLLLLSKEILKEKFYLDIGLWKKMILYALPLLLGGLAGMVNETIDRILLVHWLPFSHEQNLAMNGVYGACYKLSILMTLAIQAFRMAAEPFYFAQSKEKNAAQVYATVMKHFVIICLIIFLGVMLYIDQVKYFIGEKYWEGLSVVPVLLLANLFLGVYYNLSVWYKISGKTIYGAYIAVLGALITLLLNFWWIPALGYIGSAWATLICYFSMALLCYLFGQKFYPVSYPIGKIGLYFIFAISLFLISTKVIAPAFENSVSLKIFLNTLLLLTFMLTVLFFERPLKKLVT